MTTNGLRMHVMTLVLSAALIGCSTTNPRVTTRFNAEASLRGDSRGTRFREPHLPRGLTRATRPRPLSTATMPLFIPHVQLWEAHIPWVPFSRS